MALPDIAHRHLIYEEICSQAPKEQGIDEVQGGNSLLMVKINWE